MTTNLSACEYWLLDTVLSMYVSTADLLLDDYDGINVYPFVPIFSKDEIINSFEKLFSIGYLLATRKHGDKTFVPKIQDIQKALSQKNKYKQSFFYLLTGSGGKKCRAISFSSVSFYVFTKVGDFNCQVI